MIRAKHWVRAAAMTAAALSSLAVANPFPGYGAQGFGAPGAGAPFNMNGVSAFTVTTSESAAGYLVNLFLRGIEPREVSMRISGNLLIFERTTAGGQSGMGGFTFGASTFNWSLPLPADADVARIEGRVQPQGIQMFIPRKQR